MTLKAGPVLLTSLLPIRGLCSLCHVPSSPAFGNTVPLPKSLRSDECCLDSFTPTGCMFPSLRVSSEQEAGLCCHTHPFLVAPGRWELP